MALDSILMSDGEQSKGFYNTNNIIITLSYQITRIGLTFTCCMTSNKNNIYTTMTDTMSANTRITADARNGNGNFEVVHLGKEQRPISVMKLAEMEDLSWKRGATFNHLAKVMRGYMTNYTMVDLMIVVANKLPISTKSVMEEAEATGERLKKKLFMIEHL